MELHFETEQAAQRVSLEMNQRRQIHLIFKELVTNAAKHSGGANLFVRVSIGDGDLKISVADDGQGLQEASRDGTGLRSVRRRAREIGARLIMPGDVEGQVDRSLVRQRQRTRDARGELQGSEIRTRRDSATVNSIPELLGEEVLDPESSGKGVAGARFVLEVPLRAGV